ncbi:hypothetical protein HDK90DRAFT_546118 [Phyllosticta capitalensis]|uniref:Retrotransposon Copia-like N-terminal domain-containing protein n=1 Tax=Phyllosticta capitalensis TaxID=121624 RepID=A0ABR1YZ62_9PEZI
MSMSAMNSTQDPDHDSHSICPTKDLMLRRLIRRRRGWKAHGVGGLPSLRDKSGVIRENSCVSSRQPKVNGQTDLGHTSSTQPSSNVRRFTSIVTPCLYGAYSNSLTNVAPGCRRQLYRLDHVFTLASWKQSFSQSISQIHSQPQAQAAMSTSCGKTIPKLKGDKNFELWEEAITDILTDRNLWGYVSGEIEMPHQLTFASIVGKELSEYYRYDSWVESEQLSTSKALFEELQARYKRNDDDETMKSWWEMSWDGSTDMSDFLDEWTKRLTKCLDAGFVISEVWQTHQLVWSVREEGNSEVDTWASQVLEEEQVSPLDVLLAELASITEDES